MIERERHGYRRGRLHNAALYRCLSNTTDGKALLASQTEGFSAVNETSFVGWEPRFFRRIRLPQHGTDSRKLPFGNVFRAVLRVFCS